MFEKHLLPEIIKRTEMIKMTLAISHLHQTLTMGTEFYFRQKIAA